MTKRLIYLDPEGFLLQCLYLSLDDHEIEIRRPYIVLIKKKKSNDAEPFIKHAQPTTRYAIRKKENSIDITS